MVTLFRQGCSCYFLGVKIEQIVILGEGAQNWGHFGGIKIKSIN